MHIIKVLYDFYMVSMPFITEAAYVMTSHDICSLFFNFHQLNTILFLCIKVLFYYVTTPNECYHLQGDEESNNEGRWWLCRKRKGMRKWPTVVDVAAKVQSSERHLRHALELSCPATNSNRKVGTRCCGHQHPEALCFVFSFRISRWHSQGTYFTYILTNKYNILKRSTNKLGMAFISHTK